MARKMACKQIDPLLEIIEDCLNDLALFTSLLILSGLIISLSFYYYTEKNQRVAKRWAVL